MTHQLACPDSSEYVPNTPGVIIIQLIYIIVAILSYESKVQRSTKREVDHYEQNNEPGDVSFQQKQKGTNIYLQIPTCTTRFRQLLDVQQIILTEEQ